MADQLRPPKPLTDHRLRQLRRKAEMTMAGFATGCRETVSMQVYASELRDVVAELIERRKHGDG